MWICALIRETETEVATTTWIPDLVPEVSPIQSQPTQAQAPAGPRAKEMNMAQDSRISHSMNTNTDPEMKQNEQGLDVVTVVNESVLRKEIEIELLSCGGKNLQEQLLCRRQNMESSEIAFAQRLLKTLKEYVLLSKASERRQ